MKESLLLLSPNELRSLASALRTGRICVSISPSSLARFLPESSLEPVAAAFDEMAIIGMSSEAIAYTLDLLAASHSGNQKLTNGVQLVMSGPQLSGFERRDTGVVVGDLFRNANESVLVVGYAVYQGKQVFYDLANRMSDLPALKVQMFLDISRKPGDTTSSSDIVQRFVRRFRSEEWPNGTRLPQIFYDPRALSLDRLDRATLHAKCVVVDCRHVFISSANFTEAAQERNVELGAYFESESAAKRISGFFAALADSERFCRAT